MNISTPATVALTRAGVGHRVHRYEHDPAVSSYGAEAAAALGVDVRRIFKTLVVSTGGELVVAVVPVSSELDLKALAKVVGAKRAEMADVASAERSSGYVVGGISPVGQKRSLPTIIDQSAAGSVTIFVSGGRRGLEIELDPADLLTITHGRVAPIARSS